MSAGVLSAALERLQIPLSQTTRQGLDRPDDAAILDRQAAPVDVLSVDFFQSFLDDPYLVGRISALHALGDLWAMGSEPLGAMALVTIPEGPPRQQTELLFQLLAGGLRELTEAGATLWGGHTTVGPELTLGYTVAGKLGGQPPFTKGNLRPGDRLILTKPLGTATLLAGHRLCQSKADWMEAMLQSMLRGNAPAARLARQSGALAVTDVTGFGLAGHMLEMLDASGVSARLDVSKVPLLPGFSELCVAGVRSSLDPANRETMSRMQVAGNRLTSLPAYHALFDPQTSGGLLIGIHPDQAEELLRRLQEEGHADAALIGESFARDEVPVLLVED